MHRFGQAIFPALVAFSVTVLGVTSFAFAQSSEISASKISGDPDNPRRHTRIKNTQKLSREEAERLYRLFAGALAGGYTSSGLSVIQDYQSMRKFNTAPYLSSSHGNHYLNNYANTLADDYGSSKKDKPLPEGAILFKDSFSVEQNRQIILGPLFVMEKMAKGFNPLSGDWKFTQIQPTGEITGETNGENSGKVNYCIECHITRADDDHLFYIPEEYRAAQ